MSTKSFGLLYDPTLLLLQHILSICKHYIQIYFLSKIGVLQLQFLIFMYILLLLVLKCKNTTTILLWKLESRNSSDSSQKALFLHHYKVRNININLFKSICSLKFWRKKTYRRHPGATCSLGPRSTLSRVVVVDLNLM